MFITVNNNKYKNICTLDMVHGTDLYSTVVPKLERHWQKTTLQYRQC